MARLLDICVLFRTTRAERRAYKKAAKLKKQAMSDWIRRALLKATKNGNHE